MIKVTVQDLSTKEDRTRRKSLATSEELASFRLSHSQNPAAAIGIPGPRQKPAFRKSFRGIQTQ